MANEGFVQGFATKTDKRFRSFLSEDEHVAVASPNMKILLSNLWVIVSGSAVLVAVVSIVVRQATNDTQVRAYSDGIFWCALAAMLVMSANMPRYLVLSTNERIVLLCRRFWGSYRAAFTFDKSAATCASFTYRRRAMIRITEGEKTVAIYGGFRKLFSALSTDLVDENEEVE